MNINVQISILTIPGIEPVNSVDLVFINIIWFYIKNDYVHDSSIITNVTNEKQISYPDP